MATQDPRLRERFEGLPEHVTRYFVFVAEEARRCMAELGFRTMNEMIGRVDRLEFRKAIDHWKAKGLDFSNILYFPEVDASIARHCVEEQDHGIDDVLDHTLIELSKAALEEGKPVAIEHAIRNFNLATGTMLGSEVTRRLISFRTMNEMIGRVDRLEFRKAIDHWKAKGLDFSNILYFPEVDASIARHCVEEQDHGIDDVLDHTLGNASKACPSM